MIASIIITTVFFITIAIAAIAAWSDFRVMKIENNISIIIFTTFIIALGVDTALIENTNILGDWWSGPLAGIITFVITFAMFTVGMIGGGDSKLASALALWVGLKGLIAFLFYMSLTGGILALIAITCKNRKFLKPISDKMGIESWIYALYTGKNVLPYGIAIFIGAIGAFSHIELFQRIMNSIYI